MGGVAPFSPAVPASGGPAPRQGTGGRGLANRSVESLDAERQPQHQRRFALGPPRHGGRRDQRRAVEGAGELVQLHRHARLQEALGVGIPLSRSGSFSAVEM